MFTKMSKFYSLLGIFSLMVSVITYSVVGRSQSINELTKSLRKREISVVSDSVTSRIKTLLFFWSEKTNAQFYVEMINHFGSDTRVYIVKKPDFDAGDIMNNVDIDLQKKNKVTFIDYSKCFTTWVQDYFLRFSNGNSQFIVPTYSTNLEMNECRPFELGIADSLTRIGGNIFDLEPTEYSDFMPETSYYKIGRVDNKNGDIFANVAAYSKLFPIKMFKYLYGEGGMRIPTESFLFIDNSDLIETLKRIKYYTNGEVDDHQALIYLEEMFGKKIIPIGSSLAPKEYYIYHIDMFLTPVELPSGNTVVFLGHPQKTEDILGKKIIEGMSEIDNEEWQSKKIQANKIEAELIARGLSVERVPILFLRYNGIGRIITFNNVIQNMDKNGQPYLLVPDYFIENIQSELNALKKSIVATYSRLGLESNFIRGGERFLDLNGQIRCATGVMDRE